VLDTVTVTVGLSVLLHGLTAGPLAGRYARWFGAHPRETQMEQKPAVEVPARRSLALGGR
jgi:NhaP-type Na+/H+ or K+/H+ antiporter